MDALTKSLRLPEAKQHEVVLIRLKDGTVVARTREEIDKAAVNSPPPIPRPASR